MEPVAHSYVVTCLYGLERELADEVRDRLGVEAQHGWSEVLFEFDGRPRRLHELRLAGNVFVQFDSFLVGPTVPDLDELEGRLRALPVQDWESLWTEFNGEAPESGDVSASVNRTGEHNYTYKDIEDLACEVVREATGRRTTLDPRALELRIDIRQERCRLAGRLSAVPLSDRSYKVRRDRAETDPSLAAAMLRMSAPATDDRFLDPFCGTGTVAIERALLGPSELIVAGDVSSRRIQWAAMNVAAAGVDVTLATWDAYTLPVAQRSFSRIVASPPHSNPEDGRPWRAEQFAHLLALPLEALEYGGISVWLVRHSALFEKAVARVGLNRVLEVLKCDWKGRPCYLYVLEKVP